MDVLIAIQAEELRTMLIQWHLQKATVVVVTPANLSEVTARQLSLIKPVQRQEA